MRGVEVNSVLWDAPSGTSYAASVEDYRLLENLNKMATESYSKMTAEAVVLNGNMQQLQAKCAAHAKRDCQWSRRCCRLQYSGSHVFRFSFADSEMAPFLTQIDQVPPRTRRPCARARAHRPLAHCAHACMQRLCPGVHLHCEPCLPLNREMMIFWLLTLLLLQLQTHTRSLAHSLANSLTRSLAHSLALRALLVGMSW